MSLLYEVVVASVKYKDFIGRIQGIEICLIRRMFVISRFVIEDVTVCAL